ncbi:MAG: hypothetical protein AAFV54_06650 [Pseudomonadota bacterium]
MTTSEKVSNSIAGLALAVSVFAIAESWRVEQKADSLRQFTIQNAPSEIRLSPNGQLVFEYQDASRFIQPEEVRLRMMISPIEEPLRLPETATISLEGGSVSTVDGVVFYRYNDIGAQICAKLPKTRTCSGYKYVISAQVIMDGTAIAQPLGEFYIRG